MRGRDEGGGGGGGGGRGCGGGRGGGAPLAAVRGPRSSAAARGCIIPGRKTWSNRCESGPAGVSVLGILRVELRILPLPLRGRERTGTSAEYTVPKLPCCTLPRRSMSNARGWAGARGAGLRAGLV